jgi:hypothetical protein
MMKLLDSLTVYRPGEGRKKIELYSGDLSALEPAEAVDVLVVSAFRGMYIPTPASLIGALHRNRGLSVEELARDKAVDLREYFSCWLSRDLSASHPDCGFRRILCFEPQRDAHGVVDHLFQSLAPFLGGKLRLSTVAMPLVGTRALGSTVRDILTRVVPEAVSWMALGFPLTCLKIVEYNRLPWPGEAAPIFAELKALYSRWDVFLSYSHQDRPAADVVYDALSAAGLQVFRDVKCLLTGSAWWDEIRNAIRTCSYFVPLYSVDYLRSDTCMSEFSIALASNKPVLFPLCLCGVPELPAFMTHTHMELCPRGEADSLRRSCGKLVGQLRG